MVSDSGIKLQSRVTELYGAGPERAAQLARLRIFTIGDLLLHRPSRYEDRRNARPIRDLALKEPTLVRGKVVAMGVKRFRKGARSVFELILDDGTARLHCRWWNLPYMEDYFSQGDEVVVYGKAKALKPRTMDHPETEVIEAGDEMSVHVNRVVPIYPLTEGLPQRWLRGLIWRTLPRFLEAMAESGYNEAVPGLPSRQQAIAAIHFPNELAEAELARRRLAFDEFLVLQLQIQKRRRNLQQNAKGLPCRGNNSLIKPFLKQLGFELTEILAGQHYLNFKTWFEPLGVPVEMQTGHYKTRERTGGKSGRPAPPALFIGTHALIQGGFAVENLGLVVIDEQHKFGVTQREELVRKGHYPHLLVMTATPIPRTLGLTVYGDLDSSVIDQLPLNRGKIRTFIRSAETLPKVFQFIRSRLKEGRQAYVVYPRVEETDDGTVKAVMTEFDKLQTALAPFQVGLLHGRLPPEQKERVAEQFRKNQVQVLLATSIIEVGVDVPNATVMLIENAEQFGLAQLHQIRGRVGRGSHESYCILIADARTREARQRLRVLEKSNDGFVIAEADLSLRGPGELLGQEQSGSPSFRFANLATDALLVEKARDLAGQLLQKQPD
jgi:ATP-dependent DNA helicase RecG